MNSFTQQFFVGNRRRLRAALPSGALVALTANGTLQRSADTTFPFCQDRNFWYLTGINDADVVFVMTSDDEYLIVPKTSATKDVFDGALDMSMMTRISGIGTVLEYRHGWRRLKSDLQTHKSVYTISVGASYHSGYNFFLNPARKRLAGRLRRARPGLVTNDIREHLTKLRVVKQPEELEAIRQAVNITTESFSQIRSSSMLASYGYEYELEADLTRAFRTAGADGHAYEPIVAAGKNATTLHYTQNSSPLAKNELIVVDAGAEYIGYAADITRTISARKPSARQQAIHDAVVTVQAEAQRLLKPGVLLREYEHEVVQKMARSLKELGLINSVNNFERVRRYYPHATSHFLGLDVHDVGFYEHPLAENMVLTCEPGIYIPEEGIGVRIEDDLVITASGNENLSEHCPYDAYLL